MAPRSGKHKEIDITGGTYMPQIRIKYFTDAIERLTYIDGKSDWIDLRASEEVTLKAGSSV